MEKLGKKYEEVVAMEENKKPSVQLNTMEQL